MVVTTKRRQDDGTFVKTVTLSVKGKSSLTQKVGRPRRSCRECSTVGTLMQSAIEKETGRAITCGTCGTYLKSLNTKYSHDAAAITQKLYAEIAWPPEWRAKYAGKDSQKNRIGEIVATVLASAPAAGCAPRRRPVPRGRSRRSHGAFTPGNGPVRFIRSSQFQFDILNLIAKIPPDVTAIAGVARSGLSAATMLSMYLHLPMITIRQTMGDVIQTGNGWRLGGSKHVNPRTEKILIVDDTVMTGNSLKAIAPLVDREFGNAVYSAIYVNPLAHRKPDIWSVDLPWPHLLEWNVFNSILSPSAAMDFDGILCHDCPPESDDDGPRYLEFIRNAQPLYVPRRCPVPLIVTARIERYRAETENWLRRHGIAWHRLVMHPAKNLSDRRRDNIAAYKARHYSLWAKSHIPRPGPHIFFESDDRQAYDISRISKLLTVCPHTAGCYQ